MKAELLDQICRLHQLFLEGKLSGPEKHEVNPGLPRGSRENYLYFTLPCCLNFQRSSPALWQSALDTFEDTETRYLFFPEEVCQREPSVVALDLRRHKLAIQTNKHPDIWMRICHTLYNHYKSDPREILLEGGHQVNIIIKNLQIEKKDIFPYLGGIKLSNYWLFILTCFTDVVFHDPENISIIPDTHVIKSTIRLGLVEHNATPKDVEMIWREVLKEVGILPTEMHSVLWRWSRSGFSVNI